MSIDTKTFHTFFIILIFARLNVFAQDIHFSQFFLSPVSLNPALSGNHSGEWRLADVYRNQWFTLKYPFKSHYFSFDKQLFLRKNKLSYGLSLVDDNSGDDVYHLSKYFLNLSWHPDLGKNHFHLGVQTGYVIRKYDFTKLTFPDQYDKISGYYDPTFPTADAGLSQKIDYYDLNAGISWNKSFHNIRPEAGIAFFHINRPKESFNNRQNFLPLRKTAFFRLSFPLSEKWIVTPSWMFSEMNKASEMLSGFYFNFKTNQLKNSLKSINTGVFLRNGFDRNVDALIFMTGLSYRKFDLGLGYDINISGLGKYTTYQGAVEITLIYTAINKVFDQYKIPCERF
ncbi:MAG TPA: PorP/SprF family type IX secretion system membrane protein [Bacteroidia bacterium]|nr:PorP/SprF family type IX secretion system membrane protein [Bacteroidia bacterium]HRS58416.1 PorP/SprF family type IX secretion system membrane protein [Bacteroidia bacterium]HRU69315.1 PorP/SprF family type IX secretion system membrane protein [Bacteroidia bacterium]